MSRFVVRSRRTQTKIRTSPETEKADAPGESKTIDWNADNAAFLAEYNKLIEAEGVALEEFRLF